MPERSEVIIDTQLGGAIIDFERLDAANLRLADGIEDTKSAVKEYADLWIDLEHRLERAGVSIESVYDKIEGLDNRGLQNFIKQLEDAERQAEETAKATDKINPPADSPASPGRAPATPTVPKAPRTLPPLTGEGFNVFSRDLDQFGIDMIKAERAADETAKTTARLASATDKASDSTRRLAGTAREATNVLKGTTGNGFLSDLIDVGGEAGGGGVFGLAIAGIIAIGAVVIQKTEEIRAKAEENLKRVQAAANAGLVGGFDKRLSDLDKLKDVQREIQERRALGEALPDIAVLGREENKGLGSESDIDVRIKKIEEGARRIQSIRFQKGEDNIFDNAAKSLRDLAFEANRSNEVDARLTRLREAFQRGDIESVEDYQKAIKNLEGELKRTIETSKIAEESRRESAEHLRFQNQTFGELRGGFDDLSSRLNSDNPLVSIFESGSRRMEQFRINFGFLGRDIVSKAREMNERVQSLELFKAGLASQARLDDLLQRAGELRSDPTLAGAFFDNRQAARAQAEITATGFEQEARRLRGFDDSQAEELRRRVGQLTAGLSGIARARTIEELTRGVSGDVLSDANLDRLRADSLDELARDTRRRQSLTEQAENRRIEFAEKSIRDAEARLAGAGFGEGTPEKRAAEIQTVDFILGALGKIDPSKLPPSLLDAQLKFIERRDQLERSALEDARKQVNEQTELLKTLKATVESIPSFLKSTAIVELRDRATIGTFELERTGGTAIEFED
jgi:hypothetical protein